MYKANRPSRPSEMGSMILKRIADSIILSNDTQSCKELSKNMCFYVEEEFSSSEISIEVEKIGNLDFPIDKASVDKLLNISSEAKFGLREQTLLDKSVRDTQVITPENLNVMFEQQSLARVLNKMRKNLGLDDNCRLVPHLHNLLVYGEGQFFKKHQDTEKLQNMVATLVIVLPSPHIGGDLVIEHGSNKHTFSSENICPVTSKCIVFYSDCVHEVQKVKQGFRITLTYNVVLESNQCAGSDTTNSQLKEAIKDYFAECSEQKKMVFFLNHSYTEHSLKFSLLKGKDRTHVSAILSVAKQLKLICHLSLVDIKESWITDSDHKYDSKYANIVEFNEEEITLCYWIARNDTVLPYDKCRVSDNEICWIKDTKSFSPVSKIHEGFTGNAGGSMDYWYKRAALVLWEEAKKIPITFRLNSINEINNLISMTTQPGYEETILEIIEKAGENMYQNKENIINNMVRIALYIKNAEKAKNILTHFEWDVLIPHNAELFVNLQVQYGISWLISVFQNNKNYQNRLILKLNTFAKNFIKYNGDRKFIEFLLDVQNEAIIYSDQQKGYLGQKTPKYINDTLPKRIEFLKQLFEACSEIENISALNKAIEYVSSNQEYYPEISLAGLFVKLRKALSPNFFANFVELKNYLIKVIEKQISLGLRSANDWSITATMSCSCELCLEAQNFLHSKHEKSKIWPLAERKRTHVKRVLTVLGIPVDVTVERSGSPHKLLLIKNNKLHSEASKKFDSLKSHLKFLKG